MPPASSSPPPPSVLHVQLLGSQQASRLLTAPLPSSDLSGLLPGATAVSGLQLAHGDPQQTLHVRILHNHALITNDESSMHGNQLNQAIRWLLDASDSMATSRCPLVPPADGSPAKPVLGVSVRRDERGQLRLLQLSSPTRCLLLRVPSEEAVREFIAEGAAAQGAHAEGQEAGEHAQRRVFTTLLRDVIAREEISKAVYDASNVALALWHGCVDLDVSSCLDLASLGGPTYKLSDLLDRCFGAQTSSLTLSNEVTQRTGDATWGANVLPLPYIVAAALEAQACCAIATRLQEMPPLVGTRHLLPALKTQAARCMAALQAASPDAECTPHVSRLRSLARHYFSQSLRGTESFNPFVSVLFSLPFPSPSEAAASLPPAAANQQSLVALGAALDSIIERGALGWVWNSAMEPNFDNTSATHPLVVRLGKDDSQGEALEAQELHRIHLTQGHAGTGRTTLAAIAALQAITRCSTIAANRQYPDLHRHPQRVLCVADSEQAARHLANELAALLPPSQMQYVCTPQFADEWLHGYERLQHADCVQIGFEDGYRDAPVMVTSLELALSESAPANLLCYRQTLIVDSAQAMWELAGVLLLRRLPHLERLLLFGDPAQLSATFAGQHVRSVWEAARAAMTTQGNWPKPFHPHLSTLNRQHRLPPHLNKLVAGVFYPLSPLPLSSASAPSGRCVAFVDIASQSVYRSDGVEGSWTVSQPDIDACVSLWNHYAQQPDFTADDIIIIALCAAHRQALIEQQPSMGGRVLTVEQAEGQQAAVVVISVGAPGLRDELLDRHRICVAMSRASSAVFIVADKQRLLAALPRGSVWHDIAAAATEDPEPKPQQAVIKAQKASTPPRAVSPMPQEREAKAASQNGDAEEENDAWDKPSPVLASVKVQAAPAAIAAAPSVAAPAPAPAPVRPAPAPKQPPLTFLPMPKRHPLVRFIERLKTGVCNFGGAPSEGGRCTHGNDCGQLHFKEFWVRATPAEWWLCTAGSRTVRTEKVSSQNQERARLLGDVLVTPRNKALIAKYAHEFGLGPPPPHTAHSAARSSAVSSAGSSPAMAAQPAAAKAPLPSKHINSVNVSTPVTVSPIAAPPQAAASASSAADGPGSAPPSLQLGPSAPSAAQSVQDAQNTADLLEAIRASRTVTLSGLGAAYRALHMKQWNSVSKESIAEFVKSRPEIFSLRPNPDKLSDPIVARVATATALLPVAARPAPALPKAVFRPVPGDLWKMLPCRPINSSREDYGADDNCSSCPRGESCTYLHKQFWVVAARSASHSHSYSHSPSSTTYWLLTPGSHVIYVDEVSSSNTKRDGWMHSTLTHERNQRMMKKYMLVMWPLIPAEDRQRIAEFNGVQLPASAQTQHAAAASNTASSAAAATGAPASASASASSSTAAAAAASPAPADDEFVPVSARHALKHPDKLAAALAAEMNPTPTVNTCIFCGIELTRGTQVCGSCDTDQNATVEQIAKKKQNAKKG